jgi:hypothetical protein
MKIKSVELMRDIRSSISLDIQGMDWKEEQQYLASKIKAFESLTKSAPNTTLNSDPSAAAFFSRNSS